MGHRLIRSYASPLPPSDRAALATRLQKHRGECIRALTADLAEQNTQMSDGTLGAVLALLLSEVSYPSSHFHRRVIPFLTRRQIQQTFSPSWPQHLSGAATIINLRGGFGHLVFTRPSLRFVYRIYAM